MRIAVLALFLVPLLAVPAAFADDAAERTELAKQVEHYEVMLRDAKTETAAKYFLDRLIGVLSKLHALEKRMAHAEAKEAAIEAPPLTWRVDQWLRARIRNKVREKDIGISDVTAWTRRELPEDLFIMLATWLGVEKPLTPEAARKTWEARPKKGWLDASYGSGTFVVSPPKIKEPAATRAARRKARGAPGGVEVVLPKPPTRDGWWARASTKERTDWTMAFFVQNSALFEVADSQAKRCVLCDGKGLITKTLQNGRTITYLCTRCGGAGKDVTIRYR